MKKTHILFSIVFAVIVLLVASEVRAQAPGVTPSRTCTSNPLGVQVIAGPCYSPTEQGCTNGLAAEFPRSVTCPDQCNGATVLGTGTLLTGEFLRWDILFVPPSGGKISPSLIGTQVSADIEIDGAVGSVSLSSTGSKEANLNVGLGDFDSRWLTFSGNNANQPFMASYFTPTNIGVRPAGVAVKSGSTVGYCGVAGAGSSAIGACLDEGQPFLIQQGFDTVGCYVSYNINLKGKVIPGSIEITNKTGQTCVLEESDPLYLNNRRVLYFPGNLMTEGSCYFYPPPCTGGTQNAVKCSTCCQTATSCVASGKSCAPTAGTCNGATGLCQ